MTKMNHTLNLKEVVHFEQEAHGPHCSPEQKFLTNTSFRKSIIPAKGFTFFLKVITKFII